MLDAEVAGPRSIGEKLVTVPVRQNGRTLFLKSWHSAERWQELSPARASISQSASKRTTTPPAAAIRDGAPSLRTFAAPRRLSRKSSPLATHPEAQLVPRRSPNWCQCRISICSNTTDKIERVRFSQAPDVSRIGRRDFVRLAGLGGLAAAAADGNTPARLTNKRVAFLEELEKRACLYFYEQAHPVTGLVLDRVRTDGIDDRRIASIAATGFGLSASMHCPPARDTFPRASRSSGWNELWISLRVGHFANADSTSISLIV